MRLREAEEKDAGAIKEIADSTLKRHFWMSWNAKDIFRLDRKIVVCEVDGKVVGFALGSKKLDRGYLLGVLEGYQKRGIGKALAGSFREWHVLRGVLAFFEHIGFGNKSLVRESSKGHEYDTFRVIQGK